MHQIAQGYILGEDGQPVFFDDQSKISHIIEILEENETEKAVIWSPFPVQIRQIAEALTKNDISNVTFYGETAMKDRPDIVRSFREPNGPRCFIANPSVGGLGINLTSANLEIFVANWFTPDDRVQAEDRCHRMGQRNPVTIIDLVTVGTLESGILRKTLQRVNMQGQILSMRELTEGRIMA